jgi:hypothetical protein
MTARLSFDMANELAGLLELFVELCDQWPGAMGRILSQHGLGSEDVTELRDDLDFYACILRVRR